MKLKTDQHLIEEVLAGNTAVFGELVDRYQQYVFTIAIRITKNKEEAEEVAQDSFIKAYDSLSGYRGEAKFSSWLYRIVYHKALDRIKANNRKRHFEIVDDVTKDTLDLVENGLDYLMAQERKEMIKNCIDALPPDEAAIISMYYFDDLSIKEVAFSTGLSEDNIKIKLYRSRKILFSKLKNYIEPHISQNNGRAI